MKTTIVAAATLGLMLPCLGFAQDDNAANQDVRFEFGTTLNAVLSDTVDARKSKPGDPVKAKTSEDLKASGNVVIPRGTRLVGHVTEARAAGKSDAQARLGFVFDRAELEGGRQIPLHTAFYALAAPEGAWADRGPASGFGGGIGGSSAGVGDLAHAAADDTSALGSGGAKHTDLTPSPGAIGGLGAGGTLYASSRGVFGLADISLEPDSVPSNGSAVILASARSVRLSSGTRLLLAVRSPGS